MSKTINICRKFGSFEVVLHPTDKTCSSWYHHKGFFMQTPSIRSREMFYVSMLFSKFGMPSPNQNRERKADFTMDPNCLKWTQIHVAWRSLIHENHPPGCFRCFQEQSRGWGGSKKQCPSVFHHPSRCTLN